MKYTKILSLAFAGALFAGCADLDMEPQGGWVTEDQKADVVENNPEMISASVTGITANFSVYAGTSGYHNDFGYPSIMLFLDTRCTDLVGIYTGYNWFSAGFTFSDRSYSSYINSSIWQTLYNQIYTANQVCALIDPETEDETLMFYLAQAYAIRAFDYFTLAQIYQFTYEGNTDAPCVPLILDTNASEAAANGAPRATVGEVYDQIMADINTAVDLLGNSSMTRSDKRYVSYEVARGLRARIELVMQDWAAAAEDAAYVIASSGAVPISFDDAAKPGFKKMTEQNWLWGIYIAETDNVVSSGIINWPSHMGSLNYGYASVGAWRRINSSLYKQIQSTDARKGWFLDANCESANLTTEQQAYVVSAGMPAYTQVKFAPYNDEIYTSTNACDIILMRIEEMYLILAEAQAMNGNPSTGAATLQSFIRTYRDPSYTCSASSAEAVQNAVWLQRRIEFWGEGMEYFDIMRLRKGIDRASTEWASMDSSMPAYNYRITDTKSAERTAIEATLNGQGSGTGSDIVYLIFQIPDDEYEANTQISASDNNQNGPTIYPQ